MGKIKSNMLLKVVVRDYIFLKKWLDLLLFNQFRSFIKI